MKTYLIIALALLISFSSCIDCIDDVPMPHELLPHNLLEIDNGSYSSREYCNEEPRLLVDHQISEKGLDYIQTFLEAEELKFVPLGTTDVSLLNDAEIMTWQKTMHDDQWNQRKDKTIKCEQNSEHYDKTYSMLRGAQIEFFDEKEEQTLKLSLKGVFDCVNGVPVGIKGERIKIMAMYSNPHGCDRVIDYLVTDNGDVSPQSGYRKEVTIKNNTFSDVITIGSTKDTHKYQIYLQKEKGIVLIHNKITNVYWEPIENVKPISVVSLEEQEKADN